MCNSESSIMSQSLFAQQPVAQLTQFSLCAEMTGACNG